MGYPSEQQLTALPSVRDFEAAAESYIRWAKTWLATPTTVESLGKVLRQSLLEGRCDYEELLRDAEAGDPVAHCALVLTFDRLTDLRQQDKLPQRVVVYCLNALRKTTQPKPKPGQGRRRGQGRHKVFGGGLTVTNLTRDLGLVTIIHLVAADSGLGRTRNPETDKWPSAASVVASVLTRQGKIPISEPRLNTLCVRWGPTVDTLACAWYLQTRFRP
jgi:hypothetical protein